MITRTNAYQIGEQVFPSLAEAQKHAIADLLKDCFAELTPEQWKRISAVIVEDADKIVDVLTTTPTSKPSARRINGGKKPRTPKETPATKPTV